MTQFGHWNYQDRLFRHPPPLYELKVYINRAFYNIWQFKPVSIYTVEAGNKPGVSWRDKSCVFKEKTPSQMDNHLAQGEYTYTLSGFPVSFCNGRTQKTKIWNRTLKKRAVKMSADPLALLHVPYKVPGRHSAIQPRASRDNKNSVPFKSRLHISVPIKHQIKNRIIGIN